MGLHSDWLQNAMARLGVCNMVKESGNRCLCLKFQDLWESDLYKQVCSDCLPSCHCGYNAHDVLSEELFLDLDLTVQARVFFFYCGKTHMENKLPFQTVLSIYLVAILYICI